MSGAIDATDAGDRVSPCILRVGLANGVEIRTASINLMEKY